MCSNKRRWILCLILIVFFSVFVVSNTFAEESVIETTFFGNLKDDGKGCGIFTVLDLVLSILTGGVGIAAVVGISIVGIMYLTAGGNETQVAKAKSRLFNIVIGVAAYAVLYAILAFVIPNFNPELKACTKASDTELAEYKAEQEAKRKEALENSKSPSSSNSNSSTNSLVGKSKSERNKIIQQKIADTAYNLAVGGDGSNPTTAYSKAFVETGIKEAERDNNSNYYHQIGKSCGTFVTTTLVKAGVFTSTQVAKNGIFFAATLQPFMSNSSKWEDVTNQKKQPGDIGFSYGDGHVFIYVKNGQIADASIGEWYPRIRPNNERPNHVYRYIGG